MLINEIRSLLESARTYLINLHAKLEALSLGKLSTRIISASQLYSLLVDVQSQLPKLLSLIGDPKTNLWSFYKHLTTEAVFMDGKILIIISIPTFRIDHTLYRAISVPILSPTPVKGDSDFLASVSLESAGLLIDKERTRYQLLSDAELAACSDIQFCTVTSPIYTVSLDKTCIVNTFLSLTLSKYCRVKVHQQYSSSG